MNLSRRFLLQGAGALLVTPKMPTPTVHPAIVAEMASWSSETVNAFKVIELLYPIHTRAPFFSNQDFLRKNLEPGQFMSDGSLVNGAWELYPAEYWTYERRLGSLWKEYIRTAHEFMPVIRDLEKLDNITLKNEDFKEVILNKSTIEKMVRVFFAKQEKLDLDSLNENSINDPKSSYLLKSRYLRVKNRMFMTCYQLVRKKEIKDFSSEWREQIREALMLPLEDGCLDKLVEHGGLEKLQTLLREVPELFPMGKLDIFRSLAVDLQLNGRQTIPMSHYTDLTQAGEPDRWVSSAGKLLYRLGITESPGVMATATNIILKNSTFDMNNTQYSYPLGSGCSEIGLKMLEPIIPSKVELLARQPTELAL